MATQQIQLTISSNSLNVQALQIEAYQSDVNDNMEDDASCLETQGAP